MLALGVIDAGDKARESTELKGPIGEGDLLGVPSDVVSSTEARRGLVARIAQDRAIAPRHRPLELGDGLRVVVPAEEDRIVSIDHPLGAVEDELEMRKGVICGGTILCLKLAIAFPTPRRCTPDGVSTQLAIVEVGLVALTYLQDLHPVIGLWGSGGISILLQIVGSVQRVIKYVHRGAVTRGIYLAGVNTCFGRLPYGGKAQAPHPDSEG